MVILEHKPDTHYVTCICIFGALILRSGVLVLVLELGLQGFLTKAFLVA